MRNRLGRTRGEKPAHGFAKHWFERRRATVITTPMKAIHFEIFRGRKRLLLVIKYDDSSFFGHTKDQGTVTSMIHLFTLCTNYAVPGISIPSRTYEV